MNNPCPNILLRKIIDLKNIEEKHKRLLYSKTYNLYNINRICST